MNHLFERNLKEHLELFGRISDVSLAVEGVASAIAEAMRGGNKLLVCGNGGSAADSQHLASEFTGRFIKDRKPLAAVALTTDSSALTCISNDYSFDEVFSRQVEAIGKQGDCLLVISTSGNSNNVVKAAEAARDIGIRTLALTGREGGRISTLCDHSIVVKAHSTARIQEAHLFIIHTLCGRVEEILGVS